MVPASSEIVFDNVDFSYKVNGCGADREGGLGHADRKILDHVSFTIPAGTTTAIVGPSGSGKTTMCNLIARFWDVDAEDYGWRQRCAGFQAGQPDEEYQHGIPERVSVCRFY